MTKFAIRYPGGTLVVIWMALIVTGVKPAHLSNLAPTGLGMGVESACSWPSNAGRHSSAAIGS